MSESPLPRPIREVIDVPLDERETAARWRAIDARSSGGQRASPMRGAIVRGGALVLAAGLAVLAWLAMPRAPRPLTLESGARLHAVLDASEAARELPLSDGSTIRLATGARVQVLENGAQRLLTLVERGEVRFEVEPGTGRGWVVEAGLATVEVTGTVFEVTRTERRVRVRVERGRVLVRGETVPDRVRALGAGESIDVHAPEPPASEPAPPPVVPAPVPVAVPEPPRASPRHDPPPAAEPERERDLLADADEARRAGRIDEALALLARAAEAPGPSGALAALTRGRLLFQSGRAREAIVDLERARAGELPRSALEVATALLARAYQRAGERERAEATALEYRARFPSGRLLDELEVER